MGVFDGKIATKLKVTDPLTDHTLPHPRSLTFKSIAKTTALTGTKGAQCHLLHGDHWNEIKGNHIENIAQNQTIKGGGQTQGNPGRKLLPEHRRAAYRPE